MLGYVGGKQFEEEPWKGLLLAFVVAVSSPVSSSSSGTCGSAGSARAPPRRRPPDVDS